MKLGGEKGLIDEEKFDAVSKELLEFIKKHKLSPLEAKLVLTNMIDYINTSEAVIFTTLMERM